MPYLHDIRVQLSCNFCPVKPHVMRVITHQSPEQLAGQIHKLLNDAAAPPRAKSGPRRICSTKRQPR